MIRFILTLLFLLDGITGEALAANHWRQLYNGDISSRLNSDTKILWEEGEKAYSVQEVLGREKDFKWPSNSNPNYGFSSNAVWFSNHFSNVSDIDDWIVDVGFAQNDLVDFYLLSGRQVIAHSTQGKSRTGQVFRFPTFEVELPYAKEVHLLIRVESTDQALVVPIDIQSDKRHTYISSLDNTLWGVFYGGIFMLIIYNIVLFWGTKELSLVSYIGYLLTVVLWQFVWGGHIQLVFEGSISSWLNMHTDLIFVMVAIGASFFTQTFLNTKITAPRMHKILVPLTILLFGLAFISFLGLLPAALQNHVVYAVSMFSILSYLTAGFESYLNRFKPARYFIFAWTLLTTCALIGLLGLIGVLPSNFFTTYCFQFGVFFEAALFSIALIEKTRHQLESDVQAATNDLLNNLEIIEEQNVRLDLARRDAIKASQIKSQFLANMSHEIRTPLNAILGFSQELAKIHLPREQQEQVQIINTSASNLLAIVNDVLDFSKIEAGKLQINHEAFSVNELLEELVFINARAAQKKKVTFIYEPAILPEKLLGDGARIKQVLTNLLSNAVKFTPSGHIVLRVEGKELEDDLYQIRCAVEDTGIGINQYDKEKLFNAFSQLDDALTRSFQGTGLGLVICQQLMNLMRGEINFISEYGSGSCFEISLTCHRLSHLNDIRPIPEWQDKKIVLFDTNPATRRAKGILLKGVGVELTSIDSLAFLREQYTEVDYLLVDCHAFEGASSDALAKVIRVFPAKNKVLLHDEVSLKKMSDFHALFDRKLENPILLTKLINFHRESPTDSKNIFHHRLNELPKIKILAVDDMEINLRLLKTWLQNSPIDLTLCYGGEEAVELCRVTEFDLILMDVQMPIMDGLEATKLIRQTKGNQGTPIIAVTAHAFKEEKERLLNSGMDDYLPKPLDLAALINQIKRWCSAPEIDLPDNFDWELAMTRANQDKSAAKEMFQAFIEQLPDVLEKVQLHIQRADWESLKQEVHRLHGACCYTGVPKLQHLCFELESSLKANELDIVNDLWPQFIGAMESLISQDTELAGTQ